ncbi:SphA family protein [Acinetobacter pittii]|uniref:SphA family protein n=1 Tax=Acinetobacter pittii TaxID=48296 RepID=UPI0018AFD5A4|nr:transporter [Acinetobacter pittii]EIB6859807.1 transporter [Acinetobacter baumannii]MBF9205536.1 transporter [Acinetobacter pittii]MBQ5176557.1 phenol degradation protein meta [Acinetobacter pittii]USQ63169.1 phenol degradation protein meta [Acinetobacter pittii]UTD36138.1 phenol degradation protein meta [Acinetobacter pittii]
MLKTTFNVMCGLVLSVVSVQVFALENGADSAALGAEGTMAGAMPPTGLYFLTYFQDYSADKMVNSHGRSSIPNFDLDVNALVLRMVWMTDKTFLGGQLGFYGIQPMISMRLNAAGMSDRDKGLADTSIAALLAWHKGNHHFGIALEGVLPTGDYDKDHLANIGKNYYTGRPLFAYTYVNQYMDLSAKFSYSINGKNDDTNYRSGQYAAVDYNIGYHVSPALTVGLQGYALKQTTNDELDSVKIEDNKAQVIAYGPAIAYHPSKQWSIEGKYLIEDQVENRTKGRNIGLKFVWSF